MLLEVLYNLLDALVDAVNVVDVGAQDNVWVDGSLIWVIYTGETCRRVSVRGHSLHQRLTVLKRASAAFLSYGMARSEIQLFQHQLA